MGGGGKSTLIWILGCKGADTGNRHAGAGKTTTTKLVLYSSLQVINDWKQNGLSFGRNHKFLPLVLNDSEISVVDVIIFPLTWFQNCLFSHFSLSSDAAKIICAGVDTFSAQEMKSVSIHCRNSGKPGKQYMDSAAVALTTLQALPSAASS